MNTPDTEWEKEYKRMWNAGEFEFNHHFEDPIGKKPINPQRIWNVFIQPMLSSRDTYWKERVKEAYEKVSSGEMDYRDAFDDLLDNLK